MRIPDLKLINFNNHHEKCRICFNDIKKSEKKYLITSRMQRKFHSLTGLELHMQSQLSKLICTKCDSQLKDISSFTKSISEIQKKYYKFVDLPVTLSFPKTSAGDVIAEKVEIKCEAFNLSYEDIKQEDQSCLFDSATYLQLYKSENVNFNENPLKVDEPMNEDRPDDTDSDDYFLDEHPVDILFKAEEKIVKKEEIKPVPKVSKGSYKCKAEGCTKSWKTRAQLLRHMKYHEDNRVVCPECGKIVNSKTYLKYHIDTVHKKNFRFFCDICQYGTATKESMKQHMKKHLPNRGEKILSCEINGCDFVTYLKSTLETHTLREHKGAVHKCFCGKAFIRKAALKLHQETHNTERKALKCSKCDKVFYSKPCLKRHFLASHPKTNGFFKCPFEGCTRFWESEIKLKRHLKYHEDNKVVCPECGKSLSNPLYLSRHIDSVHNKNFRFFCDNCPYAATTRDCMNKHMKKHLPEDLKRLFPCLTAGCDFSSHSKSILDTHTLREHTGAVHKCFCGKAFIRSIALKHHKNYVHKMAEKKHKCGECDAAYYQKRLLQDHVKSKHLKTRDFACDVCGTLFATKRGLSNHQKLHMELIYKCSHEGCDKSYSQKSHLDQHEKIHLDIRDYQCHLCEKSYFTSNHLKIHVDVAHKQRTFFCGLCSFSHNRKDYLKNHLKSTHKLAGDELKEVLENTKMIYNKV